MTENNSSKDRAPQLEKVGDGYGIMLPCEPEQFEEFVAGLLGKPQTIGKMFQGPFDLQRDDIANTFHLVDQRIRQQNDASLVQFTVRILYDDGSSVLLNSVDDFSHYTEVKPIKSTGVVLSWSYLVQFRNKKAPEKQDIDLTFMTYPDIDAQGYITEDGVEMFHSVNWLGPPGIQLRIKHTDRTWGIDIESLLTGHVKSLLRKEERRRTFVRRHKGKIGFFVGCAFYLGTVVGAFWATSNFIDSYAAMLSGLGGGTNTALINEKLDVLLQIVSTGAWPRFVFVTIGFLVGALVLAVALGSWVSSTAGKRPTSFVALSREAEKWRTEKLGQQGRDWAMFYLSVGVSIVAGVVANFLFVKYFQGLM